jgi:hypothetical protein
MVFHPAKGRKFQAATSSRPFPTFLVAPDEGGMPLICWMLIAAAAASKKRRAKADRKKRAGPDRAFVRHSSPFSFEVLFFLGCTALMN